MHFVFYSYSTLFLVFFSNYVKPCHTQFRNDSGLWSLHFSTDSELKDKLDLRNKDAYFLKLSALLFII